MADVKKSLATQVKNIEARTGKALVQLIAHVKDSGPGKHGEMVSMLKSDFGIGHGDANTIAHLAMIQGMIQGTAGCVKSRLLSKI